jgi:hypothetical protein
VPILPVLVEGTPTLRPEELPQVPRARVFKSGRIADKSARSAHDAAAGTPALETPGGFVQYHFGCLAYEPTVNFCIGRADAPAMLAFMSVSGFRGR